MRWGVMTAGVVAACMLGGCASDPSRGYSFASAHDTGIRTVEAPIFENETFYPQIEVTLAESIVRDIQRHTPWKVTNGDADARLEGTITDIDIITLSSDPRSGLVQDQAVRVTVDFTFVDNRTGEALADYRGFSAVGNFVPATGTGERPEIGYRDALQDLARDIVDALRSAW